MATNYTTSFNVNVLDLQYILKQIKIAESTSAAYTAAPKTILQAIMDTYGVTAANAAQLPAGLRTVDGSFNNLTPNGSQFGAADNPFPRLTDPVYVTGTNVPGFPVPGATSNYANSGNIIDSAPRTISNLIVDMSITNPAAIEAFLNNPLSIDAFAAATGQPATAAAAAAYFAAAALGTPAEVAAANDLLKTIPNQSPDIGLSPGFNSWMTFFGQFFDHGLDLVTKSHTETVYIPLLPDDPLYVPGSPTNFMALSRTVVDANGAGQNTTTSWIDQNQTYTSHASHQVFLREYARVGNATVATGKLLDGSAASGSLEHAISNWNEVKAQALTLLGIKLSDFDVHNAPLLLTDQYGKFIPGANGYAQIVMAPDGAHATNWYREGNPDGSVTTAGAITTGHAFLNDIAHHASPGFVDFNHDGIKNGPDVDQFADADVDVNHNGVYDAGIDILTDVDGNGVIETADFYAADKNANGSLNGFTYDDEMLGAHFITGDGRGNENIALTSVHSIFHSEHNRLVDANKATLLGNATTPAGLALLNEWLVNDVTSVPANLSTLVWDGERLFQAARFATEMQYQHLVFEEFARRVQPMVDPFIFNSVTEIDPSIVAEFAHTVYRFGHSMLTGTVDRLDNSLNPLDPLDPNAVDGQQSLLAMFLNPQAYIGSGMTAEQANANLIRGLSRDVGNEIDEFIVTDVRSNLLGLPLDLAALNIARGRDTGIPSLNETRAQLFNAGAIDLKPYTGWGDYANHIKNPMSIINFIAAYGTHASILAATDVAGMRAAAVALIEAYATGNADAVDFIDGKGQYAADLGGMNNVDLWIGGLAEAKNEFGGMLGQTFNYIFEYQMESLQFGDRLYYLTRTQGQNILNNLEPNTFSDLVMRNTDLGHKYSTHLSGALFITPDYVFEMDTGIAQEDYNGALAGKDVDWAVGESHSPFTPHKVVRINGVDLVNDLTGALGADGHLEGGEFRFLGGEHVVVGGTEGNDRIFTDKGIDTIWGDGGNDYINAGTESDDVFGGEGDDIIIDPFGDDVLRGNQGNDVIAEARGADLVFGDEGNDFLMLGQDAAEAFGGEGDDFILGGDGKDFLLGNEGSDWIEGGRGFDTIAGDNSELFFNSLVIGHDVLFNQGDEGDYDAESGDDIMGSGPSVFRYEGMFGFDWGIGKNDITGVAFDLQIPIFTTIPNDVLRDRFDQVEALSGWRYSDHLDGDDRGHKGGGSSAPDSVPVELFADHLLTQEGINRINGFNDWFGNVRTTLFGGFSGVPGSTPITTFRDGNILMGGDGGDFLRGRGGYDLIDGDTWLNVRIKIMHNGIEYSAESLSSDTTVMGQYAGMIFNTVGGQPDFNSPAFGGRSLTSLMLDGKINPGSLSIVRELLTDTTPNNDVDTAIFQGQFYEYQIEGSVDLNGDGDFDDLNEFGALLDLNNDGDYTDAGEFNTTARDVNGDGFISVRDRDTGAVGASHNSVAGASSRGNLTDDTDFLKNIEQLQFADSIKVIANVNHLATGLVTINDPTPFDGKVSPYVGQVLTATLTNVVDADGIPVDANGTPTVPYTFEWQTTEFGNNSGWSTIQTSLTYTVRSVDPGHVLRAVAVLTDNAGNAERIISEGTDNPTAAFSVLENSVSGTVVASRIPFSIDYDPTAIAGGGVPDVDLTTLYHEIDPANTAGGRFKVIQLPGQVDFQGTPLYQIVVDQGGPVLLDYEAAQTPVDNQYQIVVNSYTDNPANGGVLVSVRQFTILLIDVTNEVVITNIAPVITSAASFSSNENDNSAGTVTATDPEGAILTFNINGGADAALFEINPVSGALRFITAPNFEAPADADGDNVYQVTVEVSDGPNTTTQAVTVTVNNVNDAPVITSNGGLAAVGITIDENTTAVTTVTASDQDAGANVTYSIVGGDDDLKFSINAISGVLSFIAPPDFEIPTDVGGNNVYNVIVQASDGLGGTDTQAIAVTVADVFDAVNYAPVITSNGGGDSAGITIAENTSAVTTVVATDANNGSGDAYDPQTLHYSIVGGADAALFAINDLSGVLSFITAPNFEAPRSNVYNVTVQVTDGIAIDTQVLSVTVSNVNEAATGSVSISGASATNAAASYTASNNIVDPDGGTVTYQWQRWDGAAWVDIAGATSATLAGQFNSTVRVTASVTDVLGTTTAFTSAETAITGTGTGGPAARNNTLTGTTGNDIMAGLFGNDALNGGAGTDTAVFGTTLAAATFGLNGAGNLTVNTGANNTDTLNSVEKAMFTDGTYNLNIGTNAADTLVATTAPELFLGFGGADTVSFASAASGVTANLATGVTTAGDRFFSIANLTGSASADSLTGDGNGNVLRGGAGNDMLDGAGGSDTAAFSGALADYGFSLDGSGNLVVTDNRGGSPDGADTLINIENLQFGAQSIGIIAGTNGVNAVNGGAGNDLLLGFNGNDTLAGGTGADILVGGADADTFDFNALNESGIGAAARDLILDFVSGVDKLDFSTIDARVGGAGNAGNNAFVFNDVAGAAITDRGQLVYHYEGSGANEVTVIQGNVNANLAADFEVALTGHIVFNQATDLVL